MAWISLITTIRREALSEGGRIISIIRNGLTHGNEV